MKVCLNSEGGPCLLCTTTYSPSLEIEPYYKNSKFMCLLCLEGLTKGYNQYCFRLAWEDNLKNAKLESYEESKEESKEE